ncbi:MAG: hypothetical protein ACTHNZ_16485 [Trinickia sp.]|uniref:tetratricopeptide repeat protein n=1 Tax=Trinickia sp. TaxID=2571163 RepID=UPI003F7EBB0E
MRDSTAREQKFPATCARCGGRISEPVAFCPHCGAHARFALAGHAGPVNGVHVDSSRHAGNPEHAGAARREPRGTAGPSRAEPKAPSYDFEGDLDPPWPGPPTPLFASPDGDPYGELRGGGLRGGRQWGIKGGTVLVVAAFVVLYGGAVAVHRYDGLLPLPHPNASKSVEGSIASNSGNDSNSAAPSDNNAPPAGGHAPLGTNVLQPPASVANNNAAPSGEARTRLDGAPSTSVPSNAVASNGGPAAPRAGDAPQPGMSTARLPPPASTMQTQPDFAMPQQQPSVAPAPAPAQAQTPPRADDGRAYGRARGADASVTNAAARQPYRSRAQREQAQVQSGRASAYRSLDVAQAALAKSDLRGARASLDRALAADPSNSSALTLRDELHSREQERDASLSAAHACVVQSRWNCVWHNAGKALSVDASSTEAKALVDRAIVESGAATAPAGPGPDNVQVPMVQ